MTMVMSNVSVNFLNFFRELFFFWRKFVFTQFFFQTKKNCNNLFRKKNFDKIFLETFFSSKNIFSHKFFSTTFFSTIFFFENFFCDIKLSSCIHLVVAGVGGNWSRDGAWKFYWRWERGGGASVSLYPPAPRSGWGVYWFELVCPSVRLWTTSCPLCIFHNNSRIHIIFIHLIKQLQKVCRVLTFLKNSKIWIFADF